MNAPMTARERIAALHADITAWRRDLHAHPELGFEETRTAELVATRLEAFGFDEVHRGVGSTGVVGVLRNGPWGCAPTWTRCRSRRAAAARRR
jgi:hippurate hydrolase